MPRQVRLAMTGPSQGWFSTRGGGLVEINGGSQYAAVSSNGEPELWINDFFIFAGKKREKYTIAATPQHLSLIRNNRADYEIGLPIEDPWLNCVVTVKEPDEIFDLLDSPELSDSEEKLFDFLGKHSLYVGTRNNGLWRFQKGKWTQYLTVNSILPSDSINRLYAIGRLLIVCTDAGLVLIHLDSNQYDEFKKIGLGSAYFKTIYPFPPLYAAMIPHFQVIRGGSRLAEAGITLDVDMDMKQTDDDWDARIQTRVLMDPGEFLVLGTSAAEDGSMRLVVVQAMLPGNAP